jgi:hypothetical protein
MGIEAMLYKCASRYNGLGSHVVEYTEHELAKHNKSEAVYTLYKATTSPLVLLYCRKGIHGVV